MVINKKVLSAVLLLVISFYIGTKVGAKATPAPSFPKINSVISKKPTIVIAPAGRVLVADGLANTKWASVKGADIDSGAASNGMALLADGNGKSNWSTLPSGLNQLPKVHVVDDTGNATFYSAGSALAFPTVDFDFGPVDGKSGMVGADNTTLTIQEAGVYLITANFYTDNPQTYPLIAISGKPPVVGVTVYASGTNTYANTVTTLANCTQNTTIQVRVGDNDSTLAPSGGAIELWITKLP